MKAMAWLTWTILKPLDWLLEFWRQRYDYRTRNNPTGIDAGDADNLGLHEAQA
jgi:hypothetical protein